MLKEIRSFLNFANCANKKTCPITKNQIIKNQSGNIFFTLFGAVAIVGLLGTVVVSTMRGPLSTMVEVQSRAQADSEMAIASRMVLLEATELASDGDCDGDGYVEPLEYKDAGAADAPTGGGFLPDAVASNHIDPWGTEYGYCAWDAGLTTDAIACDTSGNSTNERLDGNGLDDETYTVIALISAGPDQVFGTTCTGGATPSIAKTGDDIVVEFTYATATAATGGLWNLKSGDPATAEISKNLEVTGGAAFTAGIDLTSSSAALQLGAASMLFPNEVTLATCNAANDGLIRINNAADPDILQLCDDPNGWIDIGGGAWTAGTGDDIYYDTGTFQVGIGTNTPSEALDVVGNIATTVNITAGGNITATGNLTSVDLAASGDATVGGTLGVTGATTLSGTLGVTGASILSDTLTVTGATTLSSTLGVTGATTLSSTLGVTGATTLSSTLGVTGAATLSSTLDAQGAISNSTGDVSISDNLIVTGTSDLQGTIANSTGNVAISDNVDVTGTLAATVDVTAVDVTASSDLIAGSTVMVNGDQLGPALNCTSTQKLEWTNGAGWSCATDLQGGASGGTPNLGEVLTAGDDAGGLNAVNLGNVVIGNATPRAELDVNEGDILVTGTFTGTAAVPVTGTGTRMFFHPAMSAFRAGTVTGTQWDNANIGNYSTAMGLNTTASGSISTAMGWNTTASGSNSIATGYGTLASGSQSTAMGSQTIASSHASTAMGEGTTASGSRSTAIGYGTTASGFASTAMGRNVMAGNGSRWSGLGDGSIAMGLIDNAVTITTKPQVTGIQSFGIFMGDQDGGVDVTANNTMALLGGTFVIDPAIPATQLAASTGGEQDLELDVTGDIGAVNYCDEAGNNCFTAAAVAGGSGAAPGNDREIVFNSSGAFSTDTNFVYTADGDFIVGSTQIDDTGTTSGDSRMFFDVSKGAFRAGNVNFGQWDDANVGLYSTAFGIWNIASGDYSTALGFATTASGNSSTAMGNGSTASNNQSVAMGAYTTASGSRSTAMGASTIASGSISTAMGQEVKATGTQNTFAIGLSDQTNTDADRPQVSGEGSLGVFMDQVDSYDLSTTDTFGIIGGELMIDSDGTTAASKGCIRFNDTTDELEYADDCTSFASFTSLGSATSPAGADRQIQFNNAGAFGAATNFVYTADGDLIVGSTQIDDTTTGAEDSRMYFDVSNSAFRAGLVTGNEWDVASSGQYSTAFGRNTTASGDYSTAMGHSTTASGNSSTAMGQGTTASGQYSAAFGRNTTASQIYSTAFGQNTTASGQSSTAMGHSTTASNTYSTAMGSQTTASGVFSTAMGQSTTASGQSSTAMGYNTTASGIFSTAIGRSTIAAGDDSIAMGREVNVSATADGSMGIGLTTTSPATDPIVSGAQSFGIFMGNQSGVDLTAANTMALMGGVLAIGDVAASTGGVQDLELDVTGDIGATNYCDEDGNNCFTAASVGGGVALSDLTAASATNTIANANYAQVWNWDTLSTETALALSSTSITSGNILDINSSSAAFTGTMADITLSGSNAANTGTVLKASVTGTLSNAVPLMVTNLGLGHSLRVNDATGDADASPLVYTADGDFIVGSTQIDDTTTGSEDSRMYFDVSNSAFRAGLAQGTQWDAASSGVYSTAFGYNTTASGGWSTAIGASTTASGTSSTAMGFATTASGEYSMAMGKSVTASGDYSIAMGGAWFGSMVASGDYSVAMGRNATASGDYSTAMGDGTTASGSASTAMGMSTIASGYYSTATGRNTTASGDYSAAMGGGTTASGDYSTAMGGSTIASGDYSIALGREVNISATADGSMGIGLTTTSPATDPIVSGAQSFGIFMGNQSGVNLTQANTMALLGGSMIIDPAVPATNLSADTALDIIGTIKIADGSETCSVAGDGGMLRYNSNTIDFCDGSSWTSLAASGGGVWSTGAGDDIYYNTGTPMVGIGQTNPDVTLDVTGDIEYTGTLTDVSDRRLKTDITPLDTGEMLDKLARIDTYSFRMKDDPNARLELGVMAQELEEIFPELVRTSNDEMGTKSVNYVGLIAPMIEATKELRAENDNLRSDLNDMRQDIASLKLHTGYGFDKAGFGLGALLGLLFGMMLLIIIRKDKISL